MKILLKSVFITDPTSQHYQTNKDVLIIDGVYHSINNEINQNDDDDVLKAFKVENLGNF